VDVGTQGIGGEVLLPVARREFDDAAGGMFADPLQPIDETSVRVDAVQSARDDQALDDANVLRPEFGPAEKPGLAPMGTKRWPTNLDRFRGRDKWNSAGYAAAASG
jgi:hypothetical protein